MSTPNISEKDKKIELQIKTSVKELNVKLKYKPYGRRIICDQLCEETTLGSIIINTEGAMKSNKDSNNFYQRIIAISDSMLDNTNFKLGDRILAERGKAFIMNNIYCIEILEHEIVGIETK